MTELDSDCDSLESDYKLNNNIDVSSCNKPSQRCFFRGIRSSKYRHVYGTPGKRDASYQNVQITRNAHDSNFCAVNPKFVAVVTEVAGGGAFVVFPVNKPGKQDLSVSRVTGHTGPVLDIKWNPFNDNIIASCSDDCTVKLWYIPDVGLSSNLTDYLMDLHGHRRRVAYIEWHPTAENVLASASFDFSIILWNVGTGETLIALDCHTDIIYSMSFNRDGSRLATTCKDKKLRIINPRSGFIISEGICHNGARASKVVYLSDNRVLTTGFGRHSDRQYAVWNDNDIRAPVRRDTIDSSSGILIPFFDYDSHILYLAGKGDGNIRYYEIVDEPPCIHYLNQFISDSPQRSLGFMPKRGCNTTICEINRFYKLHTTRNVCEPISMIVPRKGGQFQEDLFPDTAAPVPSLSATEWWNGMNKGPQMMSMRTGSSTKTHKPEAFRPNDASKGNINYRMKFEFLTQETIPDYRPKEVSENEKPKEIPPSQKAKMEEIKQKFENINPSQNDDIDDGYIGKITTPEENDESTKNEYQLRKAYGRMSEELKLLKRQLLNRDRRIQDLENLVESLQSQVSTLQCRR